MLRVGYTWDYYGRGKCDGPVPGADAGGTERSAWLEYVGRLYQAASSHENFCGGFLTWEDFWNFTDSSASLGNGVRGAAWPKPSDMWITPWKIMTLEELEEMYGHELASYDDLYFPARDSQARKCILMGFTTSFK